jgi:chorismate mutase
MNPIFKASNNTVSIHSLIDEINRRLLVMREVAAYKAENNLPVEDLARERKILSLTQIDAENSGLDPQSVMHYMQAQMNVAKAIQYRYMAEWLSLPREPGNHKSLDKVRKIISVLDKNIINSISNKLVTGGFTDEDKSRIFLYLQTPHLTDADKRLIINSLHLIRRVISTNSDINHIGLKIMN